MPRSAIAEMPADVLAVADTELRHAEEGLDVRPSVRCPCMGDDGRLLALAEVRKGILAVAARIPPERGQEVVLELESQPKMPAGGCERILDGEVGAGQRGGGTERELEGVRGGFVAAHHQDGLEVRGL